MEEAVKIYECKSRAKDLASNHLGCLTAAKFSSSIEDIRNITGEERERYFNNLALQQVNINSYTVKAARAEAAARKAKRNANRKETKMETLTDVLEEREERTQELQERHPWAQIFYNWTLAGLIVLLGFSFVWWGLNIHAETKASAAYDQAVEAFYSERQAEEEAAQKAAEEEAQSEAAKRERDIVLMAKLLDGIKGFVENKGYTDIDLETYAQCPVNRVLNPAFTCTTLEEAILQENQWVGFSQSNQVTLKNKQIAKVIVDRFYDEEPQPCSNSYCWTEFTDRGLYLKSDYGPATFNNVWRAGA